ncbi:WD40 repeat-like protein, partial [Backusella circina FSU 941]
MNKPEIEDRYVHDEGFTIVKYIHNGGEIVTGGSEATVKVSFGKKDERNLSSKYLEKHIDSVTTIATHGDIFATAAVDGNVILYKKDSEVDKILLRSLVPVRCIQFDPTGRKLAIASDENDIRIVLIADISKVVLLKGHTTLVKSLDYDKSGRYLISSSCDGDVRVWDVGPSVSQPTCVKVLKGTTKGSLPGSELLSTVAWNPNGSCFAVPGTNADIRVFTKGIWTPFYTLENVHTESVITIAWSPNGYYLASAGTDRQIIIWDASKKSVVANYMASSQICTIDWHPKENNLIFTDNTGQLSYWDNVIPNSSQYPHPALIKERSAASNNKNLEADKTNSLFGDDTEEELSTPDINGSQMLRQLLYKPADEAIETNGSDDNEEEGEDLRGGEEDLDDEMMDDELDDFVIDDDGAGYAEDSEEARRELLGTSKSSSSQRAAGLSMARLEPTQPFQPGETPFDIEGPRNVNAPPSEGDRRYLAFNLVGVVYTIYQAEHSIMNVEFHDQTENRNFHFSDYANFHLAAIGHQGTVFAGKSRKTAKERQADILDENDDEEEEQVTIGSTLYYRPLNSWGNITEWTHYMPIGEEITNIAINGTSVVVATSAGFIRIFSLSGVQKHIFSLSNVVSMSGNADLLLIVYAASPSFTNQQNLDYMLMNTESYDMLQKDKIQITKDSKLTWVGFSETSQAAIYDSHFIMRVLSKQRRPNQGAWVPVFNGVRHAQTIQKTERYWPVGLLNDKLMCVIVRGSNQYPFFPRPIVSDIELEMPVVNTDPQTAKLEEQYLRNLTATLHERDEAEATQQEDEYATEFRNADVEIDKTLLQLIQQACKSDKSARALDLSNVLHMSHSIDAAVKIAMHYQFSSLAEKMTRIKEIKFMGQEDIRRTTLAQALESQPSIFNSDEPSMSSNLAFVDRPSSSLDSTFISRKRDISDDFDEDADMMQTSELSPQPKRTR